MTASQSASLILNIVLSRRMPALLTNMSMPPKLSKAHCVKASPPATSATESVFEAASPPAARISATTSSAIMAVPVPSVLPPKSLTTIFAPWAAISNAISRPMPLPAPVTTATFPSNRLILFSLACSGLSRCACALGFEHNN